MSIHIYWILRNWLLANFIIVDLTLDWECFIVCNLFFQFISFWTCFLLPLVNEMSCFLFQLVELFFFVCTPIDGWAVIFLLPQLVEMLSFSPQTMCLSFGLFCWVSSFFTTMLVNGHSGPLRQHTNRVINHPARPTKQITCFLS